jgi:hypothetical protein
MLTTNLLHPRNCPHLLAHLVRVLDVLQGPAGSDLRADQDPHAFARPRDDAW